MKLYDAPRNTWVKLGEKRIFFHHIDGMYSYCTLETGEVIHLQAWTDVEIGDA
jgi:hypothetical protein